MQKATDRSSFLVTIPAFNDWEALRLLLSRLDDELSASDVAARVLIVDDGSTLSLPTKFAPEGLRALQEVKVLQLSRNVGHQRAIAIALSHIDAKESCQAVVVMDADGEDNPMDVVKLIREYQELEEDCIIFAQRAKRSESAVFRLSYRVYRWLYKALTGQDIRIGNFSLIPSELLKRVVVISEIWNHYSSGILKARLPYKYFPCDRSVRLAGRSRMDYVSLMVHGLSAISVYGDVIGVRALIATFALAVASVILIVIAILIRSLTTLAIPGWATYVVGLAFIVFLQSVTIAFSFIFLILSGRNTYSFLPRRDYHHFVLGLQQVYPHP
jgi:polyisoprenyl-phosphate glycosyltransferase